MSDKNVEVNFHQYSHGGPATGTPAPAGPLPPVPPGVMPVAGGPQVVAPGLAQAYKEATGGGGGPPTDTPPPVDPDDPGRFVWNQEANSGQGSWVEAPPLPDAEAPGLAAAFGESLLPIMLVVEALDVAFSTLVGTVQAVDSSLQEMVDRAKEWNVNVGVASEMADIRLMFAEMRRANRLETELVDFTNARTDLSVEIKDSITELTKIIAPAATYVAKDLASAMRVVTRELTFISSWMTEFRETYPVLSEFLIKEALKETTGGLSDILYWLARWERTFNKPKGDLDDFEEFRRSFEAFTNPVTSRINDPSNKAKADAMDKFARNLVFPTF